MTTEELILSLNRNHNILARYCNGNIAINNFQDHELLMLFPEDAVNIFEFRSPVVCVETAIGSETSDYLWSQIHKWLQTPIEKRKPEKKYNLCLGLIAGTRDTEYWLMKPFPNDTIPFQLARDRKNPRTIWTEDEVDKLKWQLPVMKEAIEKMKIPADGAKSLE